jgi:hypothetical protein
MKTKRIKSPELKSKRKRFGGLDCSRRSADCKSAIRQAASVRYFGWQFGRYRKVWKIF